jgi:hypothetical protein
MAGVRAEQQNPPDEQSHAEGSAQKTFSGRAVRQSTRLQVKAAEAPQKQPKPPIKKGRGAGKGSKKKSKELVEQVSYIISIFYTVF